MTAKSSKNKKPGNRLILLFFICACLILGFLVYINWLFLWGNAVLYYDFLTDRNRIAQFIRSFGIMAPMIFIILQVSQVLFAPVPGEVTGFIGGYIFGVLPGFLYSVIGLSIGSWVNILIGRSLGKRVVRKLISRERLKRFDRILRHQGIIVFFLLFVFPGFPKDYLCYFLGLSTVPLRVLVLIASIGRLPATFLLSLQGAYLFNKNYNSLLIIIVICLVIAFFCYRYKQGIYDWVDKFNTTP